MKAIVYHNYGAPDVLKLEEVEKPTPKDNEVLVKVHAASINSWDFDLMRGDFANRLIFRGFLKPKLKILGCDVAGTVEAVGRNVTRLKFGDAVFGDISACGWGAFAEYVSVPESALACKPEHMTFEQAAATPQAGLLALQGLYDKRSIQPGQSVLINGAGGGMGTFAIQIAKSLGAEVTGVDSTCKLETMHSLGADHVIDYTQEDFTQNGQQYDLILDPVAYRSVFDYKRALNSEGAVVVVGGPVPRLLQIFVLGAWVSRREDKEIGLLMHEPNKDLDLMNEFFDGGKIAPVIDRCYPLSEVPEALRYFGEGDVKGKVVITVKHH